MQLRQRLKLVPQVVEMDTEMANREVNKEVMAVTLNQAVDQEVTEAPSLQVDLEVTVVAPNLQVDLGTVEALNRLLPEAAMVVQVVEAQFMDKKLRSMHLHLSSNPNILKNKLNSAGRSW